MVLMTPSIASLEALDRIEHLGSVQAAAEALSLTPSAVSHRLRGLEAVLGFACVVAQGRGLTLTPRARSYLEATRPALATLKSATATATARGQDQAAGPLTVAAAPGFATSWLTPRLAGFRTAHPDIVLTVIAGEDDSADIAIPFLVPGTEPADATFLTKPEFFPVISPALAQRAALHRISALAEATFLHLGTRRDWHVWASACGAPDSVIDGAAAAGREVIFSDVTLLLAAAKAGLGVSLGDSITCAEALATGGLIRPFAAAAPAERAYYLIITKGAAATATPFKDWLLAELAADRP
ncbi:MAG: LysR substrate-binding domain-containing protein [Pseudomonadota bacterium]